MTHVEVFEVEWITSLFLCGREEGLGKVWILFSVPVWEGGGVWESLDIIKCKVFLCGRKEGFGKIWRLLSGIIILPIKEII